MKTSVIQSCGLTRSSGGLYFAVSALSKAVALRGLDVEVCGRAKPGLDEDIALWAPLRVHPYKAVGPLQFSLEFRRMLAGINPDLVHQHGLWLDDQWAAYQWHKKTGRPVVLSPHGMLDPWALSHSSVKKQVVRRLFADKALKSAVAIHALCQPEADAVRALGLRNPVVVIPNGVDMPPEEGVSSIEGMDGRKILLFLGRLHSKKGVDLLLKAWGRMKGQEEWKLVVAGWDDGGYQQDVLQLARELGLAFSSDITDRNSVCFYGPAFGEDKERLLGNASAFILPSLSEGLPVSVLEAWSYGLPVLMTEFCNLAEGFEVGAAIRMEPKVESVHDAIVQLLSMEPTETHAIGDRGRSLVEGRFTWKRIAEDMGRLYQDAVSGNMGAY